MAVRRLARGGAVLVTGAAAVGSAFLVAASPGGGLPALGLFVGGLIVAGLGCAGMSLSASHLWRFGDRRSLWVPVAAAGVGLSAGIAGLAFLGAVFGPWSFPGRLFIPGLAGVLGFGVLLSVLTVSALVRWLRET